MHAPLRLGFRNALHAVRAGLEFELRVGAIADNAGDDLLVTPVFALARVQHFELPAARFGETAVHAKQVTGKDCGLVAAGAGANLEKHVGIVVRIFRQ